MKLTSIRVHILVIILALIVNKSSTFVIPLVRVRVRHILQNQKDIVKLRSSTPSDDAAEALEAAARLREEVKLMEIDKSRAADEIMKQRDSQEEQESSYRSHYTVNLPILKSSGNTVDTDVFFKPVLSNSTTHPYGSTLHRFEVPLPLGIIIGQSPNSTLTTIDEVDSKTNAKSGKAFMPGDVIRACTACQTQMSTPTWQLIVGGIGQPKTVRFMFSADGVRSSFEEVMEALKSSRMDPMGRDVLVVVERRAEGRGGG